VTLPAVLYGCEAWSLIIMERHGEKIRKEIFLSEKEKTMLENII
jgi:hypothetical protein